MADPEVKPDEQPSFLRTSRHETGTKAVAKLYGGIVVRRKPSTHSEESDLQDTNKVVSQKTRSSSLRQTRMRRLPRKERIQITHGTTPCKPQNDLNSPQPDNIVLTSVTEDTPQSPTPASHRLTQDDISRKVEKAQNLLPGVPVPDNQKRTNFFINLKKNSRALSIAGACLILIPSFAYLLIPSSAHFPSSSPLETQSQTISNKSEIPEPAASISDINEFTSVKAAADSLITDVPASVPENAIIAASEIPKKAASDITSGQKQEKKSNEKGRIQKSELRRLDEKLSSKSSQRNSTVTLSAVPWAKIRVKKVDSPSAGISTEYMSPHQLELAPGRYEITFSHPAFGSKTLSRNIESGKKTRVSHTFQ